MNETPKFFIILFLAFCIGSYFGIDFVQAQDDNLVLEITKECDIQYAGNTCVIDLKITNNTGEILDGEMFLHIDYQGVCGDGFFDGQGIEARFFIDSADWLDFSNWDNGTAMVSGFDIIKGETQPKFKIESIPNLCPGSYAFILTIKGTTETGKEYTTVPVTLGSIGGGGLPAGLTIQYENSRTSATTATITWLTSYKSTSRVIYDTTPGQFDLYAGEPGYGYGSWTDEFDTPANTKGVTGHSITITGLAEGAIYYYRTVSHASPATIGTEHSFTTLAIGDADTEGDVGGEGGDTGGEGGEGGDTGGDTGAEGDTGEAEGGTSGTGGDTGDTGGDTVDTGAGDEEFEYGDHIYEHQEDQWDDQLTVIDDEFGGDSGGDSKFLASIGTFFSNLHGWKLAFTFLLSIILALIILRLIRTRIDREKKKNE